MKTRDLDEAAKGSNPTHTEPPKPDERCPRCHNPRGYKPPRCALCNPPDDAA